GEGNIGDDHLLASDSYTVQEIVDGKIANRQVAALTALNARLRDDYTREIQAGVDRWNRIPERFGIPFRITLPHVGFHRKIGNFAGHYVSPDGGILSREDWERQSAAWLPSDSDHEFIGSLMGRVVERGKFANWIAPPARGINNQPIEFEYVRFG
ncbi:MAG: benzoyl-CoA 2,3-epoxidase subunit BoxB, partial [Acidobacteriia bacterium]|nr:benzoyl-CoA 2,3-epoxidase subunit BoxB [Terriglobia bacterium]